MNSQEEKELKIVEETRRHEEMLNSPQVKKEKEKRAKWEAFEDSVMEDAVADGTVLGDDL